MARSKPNPATEAEQTIDPTVDNTEAFEANTDEGSPEVLTDGETVETPAGETPAGEAPEPIIDLTAFQAAVEEAVKSMDAASGDPSREAVAAVQEQYRLLDGPKAKGAARTSVKEGMKAAVGEGNLERAQCLMFLDGEVKSTPKSSGGPKTERKPADPTEAWIDQRVVLHLAYANLVRPEGVAENAEEQAGVKANELNQQVLDYIAWSQGDKEKRGDEPTVDPIAKAAAKLSVGKKVKSSGGTARSTAASYDGPRRNVKTHIASAFDGVASGTFLKVAEIVRHTSEEYGSDHPSPGAVSASLKSTKFDVAGVTPESFEGNYGARKA